VDPAEQRIVVGVDGSEGSRSALAWALAEAARRGTNVEVVSAFPVDFYWTDPYLADRNRIDSVRADTEALAHALVAEVRADPEVTAARGIDAVDVMITACSGAAAAHLVQCSDDAALLVVGLGSTDRGAVRMARELLDQAHVRVMGTVMNRIKAGDPNSYYRYSYRYRPPAGEDAETAPRTSAAVLPLESQQVSAPTRGREEV